MVMLSSENINCVRKNYLQKKAEIMMTRAGDVARYSKFKKDIGDNVKRKKKMDAEQRQREKEDQDRRMQEEVIKEKEEFLNKKKEEMFKKMR